MSQIVSQSEFARLQQWDKGYITKLKQAERLVMVDGKVDVEASRALIAQTSHPGYAAKLAQSAQQAISSALAIPSPHVSNVDSASAPNGSFNSAKARKEQALADLAEMERDKVRGGLVDAHEVRLFAADLGATFRAALEILPDRMASDLVPLSDADAIRAVLVEHFEQVLGDLALKIEKGVVT